MSNNQLNWLWQGLGVRGVGGQGIINERVSLSFSLTKLVKLLIRSLLGVLESKAKWGNEVVESWTMYLCFSKRQV